MYRLAIAKIYPVLYYLIKLLSHRPCFDELRPVSTTWHDRSHNAWFVYFFLPFVLKPVSSSLLILRFLLKTRYLVGLLSFHKTWLPNVSSLTILTAKDFHDSRFSRFCDSVNWLYSQSILCVTIIVKALL